MNAQILVLYTSTVLIWGSTWLAIKFQLGEVDPLISVFYRMALSAVLVFIWCRARGINLALTGREHGFMVIQGLCLFGLNYWTIYLSEVYLTSGIVAVVFSTLVFLNIFNGRLFLGRALTAGKMFGALIGLLGISALFYPEIANTKSSENTLLGLALALTATCIASFGNIIATRNGGHGHSVWVINAWGMCYGALALLVIALINGTEFSYDNSLAYNLSLIYLSLFGTILAFGAYLKLLHTIGPDKAGYSSMLFPVVALILSTFFENFVWTWLAIAGLALILLGNWLVMRSR